MKKWPEPGSNQRFAQADVTAEKAMQYVGHCSALVHAIYRKLKPRDVAQLGDFL